MPEQNTLELLNNGVFIKQLEHAIKAVALATVVNEKRKKGTVKITLDMTQIGDSHQVHISHTLSFTEPTLSGKKSEETTSSTPLFVSPTGELTYSPKEQLDLFKTTPLNVTPIKGQQP